MRNYERLESKKITIQIIVLVVKLEVEHQLETDLAVLFRNMLLSASIQPNLEA